MCTIRCALYFNAYRAGFTISRQIKEDVDELKRILFFLISLVNLLLISSAYDTVGVQTKIIA